MERFGATNNLLTMNLIISKVFMLMWLLPRVKDVRKSSPRCHGLLPSMPVSKMAKARWPCCEGGRLSGIRPVLGGARGKWRNRPQIYECEHLNVMAEASLLLLAVWENPAPRVGSPGREQLTQRQSPPKLAQSIWYLYRTNSISLPEMLI